MRDYTVMLNDGRKLGCAEYGQIDGEAVFVFHGTPGARYQIYAARLESIAQEGPVPLRIFVPERPGYGLSDAKAGRTLDDWCQDFEALADEIGVKRFSIVGISGGAPFALACTYRMPTRVRKTAVICGMGPIDILGQEGLCLSTEEKVCLQGPEFTRAYITKLANMVNANPDRFTEYYIDNLPELDRKLISDDLVPVLKQSGIEATRQVEGMVDDYVIFGQPWNIPLQKIPVPVAFWHSEDDHVVPIRYADYLASIIPNTKLRRMQDYDHFGSFLAAQPELYDFLTLD